MQDVLVMEQTNFTNLILQVLKGELKNIENTKWTKLNTKEIEQRHFSRKIAKDFITS